ncbi:hypothetical protein [Micromonospora echinofusca]|uniref:DNA-binding transcriptional regulator of glucitol operon n=1 Tax=Micromonospora echinofusca TaxID=47858 RepID=A0ABS3VLU7_MICEH|nr:hypothetical protein [Micromonospora echinofusca]MBO4205508.1 hypothetical protein [Micromonospora echinofusca]
MKRLWTPAWIARHVATVVLVAAFSALGWWQISRAASGNTLSWAYAVEWPVFAGFVIFLWWREVRHALGGGDGKAEQGGPPPAESTGGVGFRPPVRTVRTGGPTDDPGDPELAAYNRYLSWLNANPGARPGDYPG